MNLSVCVLLLLIFMCYCQKQNMDGFQLSGDISTPPPSIVAQTEYDIDAGPDNPFWEIDFAAAGSVYAAGGYNVFRPPSGSQSEAAFNFYQVGDLSSAIPIDSSPSSVFIIRSPSYSIPDNPNNDFGMYAKYGADEYAIGFRPRSDNVDRITNKDGYISMRLTHTDAAVGGAGSTGNPDQYIWFKVRFTFSAEELAAAAAPPPRRPPPPPSTGGPPPAPPPGASSEEEPSEEEPSEAEEESGIPIGFIVGGGLFVVLIAGYLAFGGGSKKKSKDLKKILPTDEL